MKLKLDNGFEQTLKGIILEVDGNIYRIEHDSIGSFSIVKFPDENDTNQLTIYPVSELKLIID